MVSLNYYPAIPDNERTGIAGMPAPDWIVAIVCNEGDEWEAKRLVWGDLERAKICAHKVLRETPLALIPNARVYSQIAIFQNQPGWKTEKPNWQQRNQLEETKP